MYTPVFSVIILVFLLFLSCCIPAMFYLIVLHLIFLLTGTVNSIRIYVDYPQRDLGNFSIVNLTCTENFGDPVTPSKRPVVFRRDGLNITAESRLVEYIKKQSDFRIFFIFTQHQEGEFSCKTATGEVSSTVELAASPLAETESNKVQYLIVSSTNSAVNFSCSVQPGVLRERYTLQWVQLEPFFKVIAETEFNISVVVNSGGGFEVYECRVTIEHRVGRSMNTYYGPVHIQVLSTLGEEGISYLSPAIIGEATNLTCPLIRGGTDFILVWKINDTDILCNICNESCDIRCSVGLTSSVLEIQNTSLLGVGVHQIECILQPVIHPNYTKHPSFKPYFSVNITQSAMLSIYNTNLDCDDCIQSSKDNHMLPVLLVATGSLLLVIIVVLCTTIVALPLIKRRKRKQRQALHTEGVSTLRPLPKVPSPPPPIDVIQQLQEELGRKNMLYLTHHLHLSKIIGEGEWGLVYRGYLNNNDLVAVKTGKALLTAVNKERLLKEVLMMLTFHHPNVLPLKGMCFDKEVPLIVMPFMSGGSVLEYVRLNKDHLYFTEGSFKHNDVATARRKCLDICHQVAKGMDYLASRRFVHRDLAARNCMIAGDGTVKVGDFGLTEDMYNTNYYRHTTGQGEERVPIRWMAPECIKSNVYCEKTDVWSYGVTCWEVFTCGRVPYAGVPVIVILTELGSGYRLETPDNTACSSDTWEMMRLCWLSDPLQRPTFRDLVVALFDMLDSDTSYLRLKQ